MKPIKVNESMLQEEIKRMQVKQMGDPVPARRLFRHVTARPAEEISRQLPATQPFAVAASGQLLFLISFSNKTSFTLLLVSSRASMLHERAFSHRPERSSTPMLACRGGR